MTTIDLFQLDDRPRWAELWTGYLTFYNTVLPPEQYEHTWAGLMNGRLHGRGARDASGRLIGITHFLFQDTCWARKPMVYLQDLFVDPAVRGGGVGRMLIEAVGEAAKAAGAPKMYWFTHNQNATARRLYDQVATLSEFVRYDYKLD